MAGAFHPGWGVAGLPFVQQHCHWQWETHTCTRRRCVGRGNVTEHMHIGCEGVKDQGSQMNLAQGGLILAVSNESLLRTMNPRLTHSREVPRPRRPEASGF